VKVKLVLLVSFLLTTINLKAAELIELFENFSNFYMKMENIYEAAEMIHKLKLTVHNLPGII
jgi:hypothetical protein